MSPRIRQGEVTGRADTDCPLVQLFMPHATAIISKGMNGKHTWQVRSANHESC
ncbi:hypothetical protein C4K08_3169 [Pseudomonas chlororaphis subsp. aureofaciens]|nr:hypothetical protein C4K08_3169 [Pseudomonas chlororaphis subsp. aureofaciens]